METVGMFALWYFCIGMILYAVLIPVIAQRHKLTWLEWGKAGLLIVALWPAVMCLMFVKP